LAAALTSLAAQLKQRIVDLTSQRDRLSAILQSMVEGVLVVDSAGSVVEANPSAVRILGAGTPLTGALREAVERALKERTPQETELDGNVMLAVNIRPLTGPGGGGVVVVLHDVTRIRKLERVRRDFVANVSHE